MMLALGTHIELKKTQPVKLIKMITWLLILKLKNTSSVDLMPPFGARRTPRVLNN